LRNIFLFIRRHFHFLLFLFLQGLSVYFIVNYSRYHQAVFGSYMNEFTGRINARYSGVQQYFNLKKTNDSLMAANRDLLNRLSENFAASSPTTGQWVDSLKIDSARNVRKIRYYEARVVSHSVSTQNNFIVIDRGSSGGIRTGMGVVDPNRAAVGIVVEVNEHYSVIMSLLHKDSHISGKLETGGETGTLSWDGKEPGLLQLNGIPKSAKIRKGDPIITSGYSTSFPYGLKLGRVHAVYKKKSASQYEVVFRSAANFYHLPYVYVIENADAQDVETILNQTLKDHSN